MEKILAIIERKEDQDNNLSLPSVQTLLQGAKIEARAPSSSSSHPSAFVSCCSNNVANSNRAKISSSIGDKVNPINPIAIAVAPAQIASCFNFDPYNYNQHPELQHNHQLHNQQQHNQQQHNQQQSNHQQNNHQRHNQQQHNNDYYRDLHRQGFIDFRNRANNSKIETNNHLPGGQMASFDQLEASFPQNSLKTLLGHQTNHRNSEPFGTNANSSLDRWNRRKSVGSIKSSYGSVPSYTRQGGQIVSSKMGQPHFINNYESLAVQNHQNHRSNYKSPRHHFDEYNQMFIPQPTPLPPAPVIPLQMSQQYPVPTESLESQEHEILSSILVAAEAASTLETTENTCNFGNSLKYDSMAAPPSSSSSSSSFNPSGQHPSASSVQYSTEYAASVPLTGEINNITCSGNFISSSNQAVETNGRIKIQQVHCSPMLTNDEKLKFVAEFVRTASKSNNNQDSLIKELIFDGDKVSCVHWMGSCYISSSDIVKLLRLRLRLKRGQGILSQIDRRKLEEGVYSDLRVLKIGVDAVFVPSNSDILNFMYEAGAVRTHKRQKVYLWDSVPHDKLLMEALRRNNMDK